MSTYDVPVSANRIVELPLVFKYLDKRYGPPDLKEPKKKNGEYALRMILKYLSFHKQSTCEEIAQNEYEQILDKNPRSKVKLKSITDDIRKFIKNNLIFSELVYYDEPKKKYNKQVETFCLSPIGIIYSMYLFASFNKQDDFGLNIMDEDEIQKDQNLIKILGKEYTETFPKIFGRFDLFEKIFGKNFVDVTIEPFMAIFELERPEVPDTKLYLSDYVITLYEFFSKHHFTSIKDVHKFIAEQISLIFYINLEESILQTIQFRQDENFFKFPQMTEEELKKYNENQNKDGTRRYREALNEAKNKWVQIMNEDKELKKWFSDFLKNARDAKRQQYGAVSEYTKRVYTPWDFKKFGIN